MSAKVFGFIILSLSITTAVHADSKNITVFGVQKELLMNNKDVAQKDFYISGGLTDGLHKGDIVTVYRRTPMHDPGTGRPMGDLQLPVAKLKIIYAEKSISIGRMNSNLATKDRPLIDYKTVMVGDQIFVGAGQNEGDDVGENEGDKKGGEGEAGGQTVEKATEKTEENVEKATEAMAEKAPEKTEAPKQEKKQKTKTADKVKEKVKPADNVKADFSSKGLPEKTKDAPPAAVPMM